MVTDQFDNHPIDDLQKLLSEPVPELVGLEDWGT